jgi:hypothetical protein
MMLLRLISVLGLRPLAASYRSLFSASTVPALAMAVAGALASCGGGVDSGGTGGAVSSFASGPITGFGSVIVNGVHFDDRAAAVTDADGNARTRDDLRLGMTTDVRGSAIVPDADGNPASTASSIVFASEILGPISAIDLAARTLTVLGQTVDITTTTAFDSSLAGGLTALAVGNVVEVYAHVDAATGHYVATRIERKTAVAAFALRGIVAGLDTGARSFALGATRISYAGIAANAVPATLANGRFVRVSLALAQGPGGVWTAVRIVDGVAQIDDREEATIKGLVSAFVSTTQFSVNGTVVDARTAQFPNGSGGLALGKRVEVDGSTVAGVLVATSVKLISDSDEGETDFDVRGAIDSIDTVALTFVVREVIVSYAGSVDFRDGTVTDLVVGRQVEARGMLSADGTRLQATRIDFRH